MGWFMVMSQREFASGADITRMNDVDHQLSTSPTLLMLSDQHHEHHLQPSLASGS